MLKLIRRLKDPSRSITKNFRRAVLATLPTETLSPTSPRLIRAIIPIPVSSAVPPFSLVVWASTLPIIGTVIIRIRIDDITPLEVLSIPKDRRIKNIRVIMSAPRGFPLGMPKLSSQ